MANQDAQDLKNEAQKAGQALENARQRGSEFVETAKEKGAELLDEAKRRGSEYVETAKHRGSEYAEQARDEARRLYREGERRAGEVAAYAEDYYDDVSAMVRRNPAQALGIAAGVGFLLGLILSRR